MHFSRKISARPKALVASEMTRPDAILVRSAKMHDMTLPDDGSDAVIAAVSGQSWADYLQEHILDPLGMTETRPIPASDDPQLAKGYSRRDADYHRTARPFFVMNAGSVEIILERYGSDSAGLASVTVTSSDDTAEAGLDFQAVNRTVSWADGDLTAILVKELEERLLADPDERAMVAAFARAGYEARAPWLVPLSLAAVKDVGVSVPVVVRLEGTNVDKGRELLASSGLDIIAAQDLTDAAKKAVAAAS